MPQCPQFLPAASTSPTVPNSHETGLKCRHYLNKHSQNYCIFLVFPDPLGFTTCKFFYTNYYFHRKKWKSWYSKKTDFKDFGGRGRSPKDSKLLKMWSTWTCGLLGGYVPDYHLCWKKPCWPHMVSIRESSRRVSQASSTLMPKNHLFNTHKTELFSQVMRDNSQWLILSTVNWIF